VKQICQIPYKSAMAAENMAMDAIMLKSGNVSAQAMWRIYGWAEKAITFGYSQKWSTVGSGLPGFKGTMIRRLTGGGIVDHRNDMTYALSIPASHPFHHRPALDLYREVHELIAHILREQGIPAALQPCGKTCDQQPRSATLGKFCFTSPEPYDVVVPQSGAKIAGAAMKRNQSGILIQGSLDRGALGDLTPSVFETALGSALARWLGLKPVQCADPLPADDLLEESARFASAAWNERR
jgi:lipoate-protein ligase A